MTLHYAKVSEGALYTKWKETELLGLLHLNSVPPDKIQQEENQGPIKVILKEGVGHHPHGLEDSTIPVSRLF